MDHSLFFTHSFEEETGQFDPRGRWQYGTECYVATYKCRIPLAFKDCDELIEKFVQLIMDDYDPEGFWVNEDNYSGGQRGVFAALYCDPFRHPMYAESLRSLK